MSETQESKVNVVYERMGKVLFGEVLEHADHSYVLGCLYKPSSNDRYAIFYSSAPFLSAGDAQVWIDQQIERTDAETGGARVMAKWVWTETDDGYVAEHDGLSTEVLGYDSSDWAWITWRGSRALSDGDDVAFGSADEAKADAEAWYERETEE